MNVSEIETVKCVISLTHQDQKPEGTSKCYVYHYDACVCVGEMIRNVCVNLAIDPDTHNGYTQNIVVYKMASQTGWEVWKYCPSDSISKIAIDNVLYLKLHVLYT